MGNYNIQVILGSTNLVTQRPRVPQTDDRHNLIVTIIFPDHSLFTYIQRSKTGMSNNVNICKQTRSKNLNVTFTIPDHGLITYIQRSNNGMAGNFNIQVILGSTNMFTQRTRVAQTDEETKSDCYYYISGS